MTQPPDPRANAYIKEIAKEAADEAVEKVMRTLGIDINDPDAIRRYHANQSLLDSIGSWGGKIAITAVLGVVGLIISALGARIAGGGGQ